MIEKMIKLLRVVGLVAQQGQQESRIKFAATSPHQDAASRRESRGGLNRAANPDGSYAGAIPQMRHHCFLREIWPKRMHDGFTGEPVKPISPYSLLPETLRKWKSRRVLRQAAVECSIQACNLRHARKAFCRKANDFKRRRDVNGSKNGSCFKLFENSRCDLLMLAHAWPAMHHAMANSIGVR